MFSRVDDVVWAIVSTEIAGAAVSTPIVWLPVTVLPAASLPLTLTVRYHRPAPARQQQAPSRSMRRLPHFCGIGFTVQRDGKRRSLRRFAGAGQRKASGLLAGVDHVIARRGGERHAGIRCRNGYGNTARRGRFTAVDLDDGPGMFPSARVGSVTVRCRPLRPWCWRWCCRCCL